MSKYEFWKTWKNITAIEKRAIKALEKASELVRQVIPKNKLIAIYVKGSFVRREMKKDSDVDMVPIVSENKYQGAVFALNDKNIQPVVVVPLSLWEFRRNKLWTKSEQKVDLRAKPDTFLRHLDDYKLIYGKPLNYKDFPIREKQLALKDEIEIIKKGYLPAYERGKINFNDLLKELFWLVELEQTIADNKRIKHSFARIAKTVADPNHIIHKAYNIRKNSSKNKEKQFIMELKLFLKERERI